MPKQNTSKAIKPKEILPPSPRDEAEFAVYSRNSMQIVVDMDALSEAAERHAITLPALPDPVSIRAAVAGPAFYVNFVAMDPKQWRRVATLFPKD